MVKPSTIPLHNINLSKIWLSWGFQKQVLIDSHKSHIPWSVPVSSKEYFATETKKFFKGNKSKKWIPVNPKQISYRREKKKKFLTGLLGPGKSLLALSPAKKLLRKE